MFYQLLTLGFHYSSSKGYHLSSSCDSSCQYSNDSCVPFTQATEARQAIAETTCPVCDQPTHYKLSTLIYFTDQPTSQERVCLNCGWWAFNYMLGKGVSLTSLKKSKICS